MLIPDRLPSLLFLVGAWIPPAAAGWGAARLRERARPLIYCALAAFTLLWAAAWYYFQLDRIPPYLPGATEDPTYAPLEAIRGLLLTAAAYRLGTRITRTNSGPRSS